MVINGDFSRIVFFSGVQEGRFMVIDGDLMVGHGDFLWVCLVLK